MSVTVFEEDSMDVRTAYCSACDRNVRVVLKPGAERSADAPRASDLVCLEYGDQCTGDMCPLFDVPSDEMRKNLNRLLDESGGHPPGGEP